jgi:hypothetical protein
MLLDASGVIPVAIKNKEVRRLKQLILIISVLIMIASICITIPGHAGITDGLVAYYPFNGNASDANGNGINGTVHDATLTTDKFNNPNGAYHFNGKSSYIKFDNKLPDMDSMTIAAWLNLNCDGSGNVFLSDGDWEIGNDVTFGMTSDKIYIKADKSGQTLFDSVKSSQSLKSSWKHVVWTMTNTASNVYIDGQLLGTVKKGGSNKGYHDFILGTMEYPKGSLGWEGYWCGDMSDLRIYNRVLSTSEIQQLSGGQCDAAANNSSTPSNLSYSFDGSMLTVSWCGTTSAFYKMYFGLESGKYLANGDIGNKTQFGPFETKSLPGATYYVAIKSLGTDGKESAFSNEMKIAVNASSQSIPTPASTPPPSQGTPTPTPVPGATSIPAQYVGTWKTDDGRTFEVTSDGKIKGLSIDHVLPGECWGNESVGTTFSEIKIDTAKMTFTGTNNWNGSGPFKYIEKYSMSVTGTLSGTSLSGTWTGSHSGSYKGQKCGDSGNGIWTASH